MMSVRVLHGAGWCVLMMIITTAAKPPNMIFMLMDDVSLLIIRTDKSIYMYMYFMLVSTYIPVTITCSAQSVCKTELTDL